MTILSNEQPVISYQDATSVDLKVAKCSQANCAGGGTDGLATLRLAWGSGSDDLTALRLLQYQVRAGTGTSTRNAISDRTASSNYVERL